MGQCGIAGNIRNIKPSALSEGKERDPAAKATPEGPMSGHELVPGRCSGLRESCPHTRCQPGSQGRDKDHDSNGASKS